MEPFFLPWMLAKKRGAPVDDEEDPKEFLEFPFKKSKADDHFRLISYATRDPAETARFILIYVGVEFTNITMQNYESHMGVAYQKTPARQLPMLEWNGKCLYGDDSIARLLAKRYDLAGQGLFEQAQADDVISIIRDVGPYAIEYIKGVFGIDNIDVKKMYNEVFKPAIIKYYSMLETYVKPTKHGFLLPSGLSYADFAIANSTELIAYFHPELMAQFPNVNFITQRVFALPQLKTYLMKRPTLGETMSTAMKKFNDWKDDLRISSIEYNGSNKD